MDSSHLVASIDIALDKLLYQRKQSTAPSDRIELGIIMRWLSAVKTFCLCSTKLAHNLELRAEGTNILFLCLCSQKDEMKEKRSRMRKSLESLLVRIEYRVVRRILDTRSPFVPYGIRYEMGCCDEEMDEWYASWSVFLKKCSTSPAANQIKAIEDSVFENLNDFPSNLQFEVELRQIETLKKKITVMRKIIYFCTLPCTENHDFRCTLTQIEPLAVSASHIAERLFSDMKRPMDLPNDLTRSMLSALLLKFNPLLHDKFTLALPALKHSGELCDPTLDLNDYPFVMKIEHCIVSLLEMLKLDIRVSLKEFLLYVRLSLLRILLEREPDRFNDVKVRNLTAAIVGDAGVRIFSFYLKDSVSDHWLQCILQNSEVIWAEVLETSTFNFLKTNVLGFLDFLIEDYLMEVNCSNVDSNTLSCVPKIREHLVFLKSFMGKLAELRNQQENLHQDVWNLAAQMAYKIESLIDQLVLGDVLGSYSMSLQSITEGIMILEAVSLNFFTDQRIQEISKVQQITCPSTDKFQSISSSDEVVGHESEKASIVDRLMAGFKKLQVVAVVGMAGLGKTTLATKVYRDSSVTHHFHVKAWCSISQVFDRRRVLLELLNQIQPGESTLATNGDDLSLKLWRSLKKRRYLIFIDDVWDTEAFNVLKESLPDDSNQSRILLTSRHGDVVPEALLDDKPLFLRHLTGVESLEILRRKLFPAQKDWPLELHEIAMEIAESCKGLPLTVVIVAGLLRTTDQEGWKDVLKILRSSTISDVTDQCESTLELSYKHLPDHLKPCFLWFGAFPEDHIYSVKRMIWLWISEGLIRKNYSKSLEDVARDYMNNLIARSLVMNVEGGSAGGVKTCRIHDLLHEFCIRKAHEESYLCHMVKLLNLLIIDEIETTAHWFPSEIAALLQRRYLTIRVVLYVDPVIGNVSNLETLILTALGEGVVGLPDTLWNLRKLRHLYSKGGSIELPIDDSNSSCKLLELQTLSKLRVTDWSGLEKQLRKFPNIRRMKCELELDRDGLENDSKVMDFSFLSQLESLSLIHLRYKTTLCGAELVFPENIKKLALLETSLPWNKIASIAKLPNLEVLKLINGAFLGDTWHVEEGEFPKLKFLKLESLNLVNWTVASDDLFPNLEKLMLRSCHHLEEVPECLRYLENLDTIEVINCSDQVVSLLKSVEEFQKDMGNSSLQFHNRV